VQLEGLGQLKNPMTLGIEPTTLLPLQHDKPLQILKPVPSRNASVTEKENLRFIK
jgi:hypothetical protein